MLLPYIGDKERLCERKERERVCVFVCEREREGESVCSVREGEIDAFVKISIMLATHLRHRTRLCGGCIFLHKLQ